MNKGQHEYTVYVAPNPNSWAAAPFCNVYAMPYPMRPGQRPADIEHRFQQQWKLVGRLDRDLNLVFLDRGLEDFRDDIEGAMGGTYMHVPADCLCHLFSDANAQDTPVEASDFIAGAGCP